MNKINTLMLNMFMICALIVSLPTESYAGPNNIYGVKKGAGSKNISGMRRGNINSGKLYGDHGATMKNNYFGNSANSSNKPKPKKNYSPPVTLNDLNTKKKNPSKRFELGNPPEGMESF